MGSAPPLGRRTRVGRHEVGRHGVAPGGAHEPHPLLDPAVVAHERGGGERERGAARARVHHEPHGVAVAKGLVAAPKRGLGGQRFQPVAPGDLDQLGETKNGVGTIHLVRCRPVAVCEKYFSMRTTKRRSSRLSVSSMTSTPC